MNATDIDNDGQNNFYYSLNTTDSLVKDFFSINYITGELSIIQALNRDYPTGKAEFQFVVDVADAIVNPLYGRSTVTVKPIDVNDNAPVFPKDTLQMQIRENSISGKANKRLTHLCLNILEWNLKSNIWVHYISKEMLRRIYHN